MRKVFFTCLGIICPVVSYANNIFSADNNILLYGLLLVVLIILVFLIWIYVETKREKNKKKQGLSPEERSAISKNLELKDKIESLKTELSQKDEKINELTYQLEVLMNNTNNHKTDSPNVSNEREEQQKDKTEENDKVDTTSRNQSEGQSVNVELTVKNGNLVKVESNDTVYYCSWKRKGKLYFKFVNNERTRKAINNRTVIIDPFCIKQEGSKSPDLSEEIETVVPGQLNDDYTIFKKAEIIYK